jgi:hypothetical protein
MIEETEVTYDLVPELAAQHLRRKSRHVLGPLPVSWLARMDVGAHTLLTALAVSSFTT